MNFKKLYFLGIGGIGMSAIARYFNGLGVEIHGYDKTQTELTRNLEKEGMKIHYDENVSKIPKGLDLVIWTPAIPKEHKELIWFRENNFELKKRAEVLGIISRAKRTAAVAGTHGKTSTTSILTHVLKEGGVDCSAFLGGIAMNYESNFVMGKEDWVVVEADEFDRSFLHLDPSIAAIMSMDPDHLDIYGDEQSILDTGFLAFAKKIKPGGTLLVNVEFIQHFDKEQVSSFGIEEGDYQAQNVRAEKGFMVFDLKHPKGLIKNLKFTLPGKHNVMNATAAIAIALNLGAKIGGIRKALKEFKGIKRRFEFMVRGKNKIYIDDYAHHPTELNAAVSAAKMFYPGKKITGVFQPHLFSRTRDFAEGFAAALDTLDEVLLMDIYPAREKPIKGIDSDMVFKMMKSKKKTRVNKNNLLEELKQKEVEVLMTLGAGDIDTFRNPIKNWILEK